MIYFDDENTDRFLCEWNDNNNYITAHTSGSTSEPKEIRLLKSDMIASASSTCQKFGINNKSVMLCPLSANYIAGKMMIIRALISGASLYMEKPSNQPGNLDKITKDVDLAAIVPSQLKGLLENPNNLSYHNVIIGGAPLSTAQQNLVRTSKLNAYATYGMTETCSHVALRRLLDTNSVYQAMPGYTFTIDRRCCLVINSSKQSFKQLTTNDVVRLISETEFEWLGRYDNVIITGGVKVHPETVEQTISRFIERDFYLIGEPDDKWGECVVMVIEGKWFDTTEMLDTLKPILAPHELPRRIVFIPEFQRTRSNKIIRIKRL